MSEPVHRCMTKATTALGDQMKYGPNWALSRRAMLTVYPDRIECGDWTILFGEISEAVLFSIRSSLFIPGYVLRIRTEERTYHFGLNWGRYWQGELPFTVKREKGSLGYSPFSIAIRVFLLGYLAYIVWQWATS